MSGQAGAVEEQMLSYVKDNIVFKDNKDWINFCGHKKKFLNDDLDEDDYTALKDWYTSQFVSGVRLAEYNPDLVIGIYSFGEKSESFKLTLDIYDMNNHSKTIVIPSRKIIPDDVLIPYYSAYDLQFLLNLKYNDISHNVYKEVMKHDKQR